GDFACVDFAANLCDLEPAQVVQRFRRATNCGADRIFDAIRRRAREFDRLVHVVGHESCPLCFPPDSSVVRLGLCAPHTGAASRSKVRLRNSTSRPRPRISNRKPNTSPMKGMLVTMITSANPSASMSV